MAMWQSSLLLLLLASPLARAIVQEYYTNNAACKQRYCVNPVFPGIHKLGMLEKLGWQKYGLQKHGHHLSFCKPIIDYDFALPVLDYSTTWNFTAHTVQDRIEEQDREAAKLFFYHLSAMGLEAWDYPSPHMENANLPETTCAKQVARMSCFTMIPKANPSVDDGFATRYFKPCKSSCQNYLSECQVDCCDDSVQCVFDKTMEHMDPTDDLARIAAKEHILTGYVDVNGPSDLCTGGAHSKQRLTGLAGAAALSMLVWQNL